MDSQLETVFDNSDGITLRGGSGKGGKARGSATASSARRSAVGQRSSVESKFGALAGNIAKNQAILRNPNSTADQRAAAQRKITLNARSAAGTLGIGGGSGKIYEAGSEFARYGASR
jgi:hypothetical protein